MALKNFALDTAALTAARAVQTLAAILSVPLIARLVGPVDYGLVALAMSFVVISIFIADCGMTQSLVRTSPNDTRTWSAVFWTMMGFGGGVSAILAALAWPIALIFHEPRLLHLLLALSLVPFLVASTAAAMADLQQRRRFRELAAIEVASALLGLFVALLLAFKGAGAWAIVIQQITVWLSKSAIFLRLTRFRPRLYWNRRNLDGHLVFARDNIGAALLYFLSRQVDPIVILKVLGAAALGNYSLAVRIMMLPQQLIGGPSQNTLYVRMAELRDNAEALKNLYLIVTSGIALAVFPAVAIIGAASPAYFNIILSAEWASAAAIYMCLAPVAAIQSLMVPAGALLPAVGRTTVKLRLQFEQAVLWVIALLFSVRFGIIAVAAAFTAVTLGYFPRFLQLTLKVAGCRPQQYIGAIAGPAAAAAFGLVLHLAMTRVLRPGSLQEIALSLAELLLVYALCGWLSRRRLLTQARALRAIMRIPTINNESLRPGS